MSVEQPMADKRFADIGFALNIAEGPTLAHELYAEAVRARQAEQRRRITLRRILTQLAVSAALGTVMWALWPLGYGYGYGYGYGMMIGMVFGSALGQGQIWWDDRRASGAGDGIEGHAEAAGCPTCDHWPESHYTGTDVKTGCAYPGCQCHRSRNGR